MIRRDHLMSHSLLPAAAACSFNFSRSAVDLAAFMLLRPLLLAAVVLSKSVPAAAAAVTAVTGTLVYTVRCQ